MKPMHERPSLAALAAQAATTDSGGGCRACRCVDVRTVAGRIVCRHCGADRGPAPVPPAIAGLFRRPIPQGKPAAEPAAGDANLGAIDRPAPIATSPSCPACHSLQLKVTSTRKSLRHYRCETCGERFKLPR